MSLHATARAIGEISYRKFYAGIVGPPLARLAVAVDSRTPVLDALSDAVERGAKVKPVWIHFALWLLEEELSGFASSAAPAALFRKLRENQMPAARERQTVCLDLHEVARKNPYQSTPESEAAGAAYFLVRAWTDSAVVHAARVTLVAARAYPSTYASAPEMEAHTWERFATKFKELLAEAPVKGAQ